MARSPSGDDIGPVLGRAAKHRAANAAQADRDGRQPSQRARKADDLDLLIGKSVAPAADILLAITQQELARRIGLSFQQLQKYEVGENRISAARLFKMSELLAVPITWFFRPATGLRLAGMPDEDDTDDE